MSTPLPTELPQGKSWWPIRYANNFYLQMLTLLAFALVLNREGDRVPSGNELVYLLYFFKAYHHFFLATDWTFQETTAGHGFFNYTTGWLTLLMRLEPAAWVGRVVCWVLTFVALLRLGRHFKLPPWGIWLGVMLWLIQRQAVPLTPWIEWMVGSFEAKCPAYICLVFALDATLRDKLLKAGLLAGLAFSFHTAVGLWGGAAIGWAVLLHNPPRRTALFSGAAILTGLPGLISSLPLVLGHHSIGQDDARFLVTQAVPFCADPFVFSKPYVALLVAMILFAALFSRVVARDRRASIIFHFELATALFFAIDFVARAIEKFNIVELYLSRVYVVFAMLLFFWQFGEILYTQWLQRARHLVRFAPVPRGHAFVICLGILLFLSLPSPIGQLGRSIATHFRHFQWIDNEIPAPDADLDNTADFRVAAAWVADHTPPDAVVIAPPWRADAFYYLRRPLIANWHAFRYDAMAEWRQRLELMVGDLSNVDQNDASVGDMDLRAREHYRHLSTTDIATLQKPPYNATWLVSTTTYPYPRLFTAGVFNVYHLPPLHPAAVGVSSK